MSDHSQLIFAHHQPGVGYCDCEHCRKLPVDVRIDEATKAAERELAAAKERIAELEAALRDAIDVADELYQQQAMPDDSQLPKLEAARAALSPSSPPQQEQPTLAERGRDRG